MKLSQVMEEINRELKGIIGFKGHLCDMNELVMKACRKIINRYRLPLKYETWEIRTKKGYKVFGLDLLDFRDYKNCVYSRRGTLHDLAFVLKEPETGEIDSEEVDKWFMAQVIRSEIARCQKSIIEMTEAITHNKDLIKKKEEELKALA